MSEVTKKGTITNSVQLGGPTLSTLSPPTNTNRGGLLAGEDIKGMDACYIKSDGKIYMSRQNLNTAPSALTVAGNGSGSSYGAGTYFVSASYVTAQGETTASPPVAVIITAAQNIRVTTFGTTLDASILSANFYVNGLFQANVAVSAGAIPQTDLTGATPSKYQVPPATNFGYKDAAWRIDGYAAMSASSGEGVTLYHDVLVDYATGLTKGTNLYLSASVFGGLATSSTGTQTPAAEVYDATRIWIRRVRM